MASFREEKTVIISFILLGLVMLVGLISNEIILIILGFSLLCIVLAQYRWRRFDEWMDEHSVFDKIAILAMFIFGAYLIWESS